ncbi:hypothetical protein [Burkholderia glumae]|uniref:hypothetical protein n=1 Tax=Burkholderia glumae TaxID=337 RepID=UPI00157B359A|nr:hypothetical protein [Burkholderia glumae]
MQTDSTFTVVQESMLASATASITVGLPASCGSAARLARIRALLGMVAVAAGTALRRTGVGWMFTIRYGSVSAPGIIGTCCVDALRSLRKLFGDIGQATL